MHKYKLDISQYNRNSTVYSYHGVVFMTLDLDFRNQLVEVLVLDFNFFLKEGAI